MSSIEPKGERIAKLLARAGVASRREVERMIADGRIALNGARIETPATILLHLRGVTVDGNPVARAEPTRLFRFHKPAGLITAERDSAGRPTIYAALRNALPADSPRLMPVGRLDLNTEGLLLLTNDGGFKRELELPATGLPRTYRARTYGDVSQNGLEDLMDGIEIDGVRYGPIDANMERRTGRNQWIELTLTEGKNREVRRVLEHLGLEVSRLLRTAYGPFVLGDLPRGAAMEVRKEELERFRSSLKGSPPGRSSNPRPAKPPASASRPASAPDAKRPRRPSRAPVESGAKPGRPGALGSGKPRGPVKGGARPARPDAPGSGKPRGPIKGGARTGRPDAPDGGGKPRGPVKGGAKPARPDAPGSGKPRGRPGSPARRGPKK
ncbi:MAG TPA: pseudouridine synthase [Croceibacterium sp.]